VQKVLVGVRDGEKVKSSGVFEGKKLDKIAAYI